MEEKIDFEILNKTLYFIAQKGWNDSNEPYLDALARFLGNTLNVDYALIDELVPPGDRARTLALYSNGELVPQVQYDLIGTPCENVMNKRMCMYPRDVQSLFPLDLMLVDMKAESYLGIPLWDSKGNAIGLIALLSSRPIENEETAKSVLQLVALRTSHEMEQIAFEKQISEQNKILEQMVSERTHDLHMANEEVERANRKLKVKSGIVRHDIANQVAILKGLLAMMDDDENAAERKKKIARMRLSVDHIWDTIQLARDYESIGIDRPKWYDLTDIVSHLYVHKIHLHHDVKDVKVLADPLFTKVFFNLLENSEKHGGNAKNVWVEYSITEDGPQIIWRDDGKGILPEHKEKIFEGEDGKVSSHALFLIKQILNVTGITIKENGTYGHGARFEMAVPSEAFELGRS